LKTTWKGDTLSRKQRISLFALLFLGIASCAVTLRAQEPSQASPEQTNNATPAQQPSTGKAADKKDPTPPAGTEVTGKSKLEKETGTVNDRIFTVMPNYGTVENASALPPLTTGQKYRIATAGAFDYFAFPFNAALAGIAQANNSPKSWGQGWGAYGKRFGSSFADNSIGTYMTTAIFPSMLKEDPRYYQMGHGTFKARAWHGIERLFVTRTDSGHDRFNFSEALGNGAATAISNIYHPDEDRTFGRNIGTFGMLFMWDGLSNEMKEFWPDIRRKVFHKQNP
jgi:hypothetical protein